MKQIKLVKNPPSNAILHTKTKKKKRNKNIDLKRIHESEGMKGIFNIDPFCLFNYRDKLKSLNYNIWSGILKRTTQVVE